MNPGPEPATSSIPRAVGRRQVLCGLAVALAAPSVLAACSSSPDAPTVDATSPSGVPLAQIPVGGGLVVAGPTGPVLLVQPVAGQVAGFDAACPHQGTTVDAPAGGVVTCPKHGSQFDPATGALRRGPANRGLTAVAARVEGANVVLT